MLDKTVLITGATKGIGLAISHRLAQDGWQVIGIARNTITEFPGKLIICDLADRQASE